MYDTTLSSVRQHPVPDWYHDAKFGVFIHWTISSVPAFAPIGLGDLHEMTMKHPPEYMFTNNPYAEWYQNSLRIPGSPVHQYHAQTYGADYPYEGFAKAFNQQSRGWDPEAWADLFERAGARYTVLVTKHHDGFLLWPSKTPNPNMPGYHAERDITGELTEAVSKRGIKMGLYYSSALDWSFTQTPIRTAADLLTSGPATMEYTQYVENHWLELIDRYQPWVLWSDIAYPPNYNLPGLFAAYYNRIPEGVVNDRWGQIPTFFRNRLGRWILNQLAARMLKSGATAQTQVPHCDYVTTEYTNFLETREKKWESVRGIGNSFAYNQFETADDYLKAPELIRMLVDIVSKNGNLLLNIGPRPDGSIPEPQVEALEGIGRWLSANGEAIYGTRPWVRPGDSTPDGMEVRYTQKRGCLYIIVTNPPSDGKITLKDIPARAGSPVRRLDTGQAVGVSQDGTTLMIELGASVPEIPVYQVEL
jgi:alpha-L-fucosidase